MEISTPIYQSEDCFDPGKEGTLPVRPRYPMPDFIRDVLNEHRLMDAYHARPPYQQNDYIGWITRAKLAATKKKRLDQMLDELKRGNVYMKWNSK